MNAENDSQRNTPPTPATPVTPDTDAGNGGEEDALIAQLPEAYRKWEAGAQSASLKRIEEKIRRLLAEEE